MTRITKDNVRGFMYVNAREYRKKVFTRAVRMDGPFSVVTREGELTCHDGYLAVDASGYPYPIAATEFEEMYERAD